MDNKEFDMFIGILILLIEALQNLTLHHHDLMVVDCLSNFMSYSLEQLVQPCITIISHFTCL